MDLGEDLLNALPVAVYATDAEGYLTHYNDAAADLWGHRPELGTARWCGAWRLYWPDGRPMRHDECPMAVMLQGGQQPASDVEAVAERPDGTRVSFMPLPRLLRDADGRITGGVNVLVDISERTRHEIEASRLAAIVASSDDAVVGKTLEGIVTSWNVGAERIFGYTAEEMVGQPIARIIPPERQAEELDILAKLRHGNRVDHFETVRVARDGRRIDISLTVSPIRDRSGAVVGASKIARDVTERKRAEETQQRLVSELNHRVKNTLAMVQAMAAQSLHRAQTSQHFVTSFGGRVQALARAHNLLADNSMLGSELADVLREQVLLGSGDDRIEISGPSVQLDARTTVHLGLVLHELSTNARHHGALSHPNGRLRIEWEVESVPKPQLLLQWRETIPVDMKASIEPGFGTSLIERTLMADGGQTTLRYERDGVSCTLRIPLGEVDLGGTKAMAGHGRERGHAEQRILVIEDEPLIAMDIENELITAGYVVLGPCSTVASALEMIAKHPADGAVLDANLHGEPVDAVAAALTQHEIPFVFATGYGRDSLPRGFGVAPVLAKPFGGAELTTAVESLFRGRGPGSVVELHPRAGKRSKS